MRKHKNESSLHFQDRRAAGHLKNIDKIVMRSNKFRRVKTPFDTCKTNRVSIINQPNHWREFFTRTIEYKDGNHFYKYTAKPKFQSIVKRAEFMKRHGRYEDLVNPVVV